MAEGDEPKENLNTGSNAFRGPGKLWPLAPGAPGHKNFPVKFNDEGYTAPEKVHTLSPEVHMEINNIS